MFNQGAYTTIDQLRDWFFLNNLPLWVIYSALDDGKTPLNRYKLLENNTVRDIEQSWEILESNIRNSSTYGGEFTVKVDNHLKFKNARIARLKIYPTNTQPPGAFSHLPTHGISGMGMGIGAIQEQINTAVEMAMLKRDNEDLQNALEDAQNGEGIQGIINRLLTPDNLPKVLSLFAGKSIGLAGFSDQLKTEPEGPSQDIQNPESEIHERMGMAMERIEKVFPDITDFLEKLSIWIEKNPDMAKELLARV